MMHKDIAEKYDELGIEPSDEILDKCVELCLIHNITDANEFVEQWLAFSISNLDCAEPTIQYLLDFERKEFINKKDKELLSAKKKTQFNNNNFVHEFENNPFTIYNNIDGTGTSSNNNIFMDDDETNEIMETYICKTPKAIKTAVSRTPASKNDVLFSPMSYSPIGTPKSHAEASGKVVYTFGNSNLLRNAKWDSQKKLNIAVKQLILHENEPMTTKTKYLFDNLLEKIQTCGDQVFYRGKELCCKIFGSDAIDYDLNHSDTPSQDLVKTIGTVFCDHDGKMDGNSVFLVGSDEMKLRSVRLSLDHAKSFGLFPGQTVMLSGINPRGDLFQVEEVFSERILKISEMPKLEDQISFIIVAGPYTNENDLVYDPLHDLITYCSKNKPDVIIMCGPFMEAEHKMIKSNVLAEEFESFFEKMISGIIEAIGTETIICFVSSHEDANTDYVYPTPPIALKNSYPNVYMLPDPSLIELNGVKIGITSTDIVDHLLSNELFMNAGDKIKRISNYLFHQGSFYPLNPPAENVCLDTYLASKYAKLEMVPNIMILPSNQKCFIRDVNSCLTLNPGRLNDTKGGTFARLIIHPSSDEGKNSLLNYVTCQVMKI